MTGLAFLSSFLRGEMGSSAPYTPLILKEEESLTEDEQELFDGLNGLLELEIGTPSSLAGPDFSIPLMISLMVGMTNKEIEAFGWGDGYVLFAAKYGQVKAFRTLRALGEDPERQHGPTSRDAMDFAVEYGQVKMMKEIEGAIIQVDISMSLIRSG